MFSKGSFKLSTTTFCTGSTQTPTPSCNCKLGAAALSLQELWAYPQPSLRDIFSLWRHHSYYSSQTAIMPSPTGDTDVWSRLVNGAQSNKRRGHKKQVLSSALKQCNNLEPLTSWPNINHEFQDDLTKKFIFFSLGKTDAFPQKNLNFAVTINVCQIISTEKFPTNANH